MICVGLVLAASRAEAEPVATRAAMEDYFAGEQHGAYALVGMGAAGIAGGALLYVEGSDRAIGAAYPLLGVGIAHVGAGVFVYLASDRRITKFRAQIASDEPGFLAAESARMRKVSRTFFALKVVEVVGIAGGLTLAAVAHGDHPTLEGVGYGLAGEFAATLVFDIIAARRAHRYRAHLDVRPGVTAFGFATAF
jgi:hypothetical protein